MMIVVASIAVALVAFIVYALERRTKAEKIVWEDALKLSLFGGLVTAGVVFASTSDVKAVAETITEAGQQATQEMFVGTPSF
jgi:uncharacterized membrane protein YdcZ (DUF606 family)